MAMKAFPQGEYAPGEIACVVAGIRSGLLCKHCGVSCNEIHNEALEGSEASDWKIAVGEEEHNQMSSL
jgi:hypothetical protein